MAVGIAGEVFELCEAEDACDPQHIQEELGDLFFYIEGYRQCLGLKYFFTVPITVINVAVDSLESRRSLLKAADHVLDLTKRFAIYNKKPFDLETAKSALLQVYIYTLARARIHGQTLESCLTANCEKLSTRYSSGSYSDGQAQARADKPQTAA